jgi:hypothetical protein
MVAEQPSEPNHSVRGRDLEQALDQIREALRGLQFGHIAVTVQDGLVIQIDRTERRRIRRPQR